MLSNLHRISLVAGLIVIILLAWAKPLDTIAEKTVNEGLQRALVTFGTTRVLVGVISVAQSLEVGVGVKFSPGQILHPASDVLGKFADVMLAAAVAFGVMKVLLVIGGSSGASLAVTASAFGWIWYYWRTKGSPSWLSKLLVVLLLVRFAVPVVMVGSDAVFHRFLAQDYTESQNSISGGAAELPADAASIGKWVGDGFKQVEKLKHTVEHYVDYFVRLTVVFLLQTLVIPLLLFWALYRVLMAMFPSSPTSLVAKRSRVQS